MTQDAITLPRDDAPHFGEPVEWWYWNGHLKSQEGARWGFYLAFFRLLELGRPRVMVHHAVCDTLTGAVHRHFSQQPKGVLKTAQGFALEAPGCTAVGGGGEDRLHTRTAHLMLELSLQTSAAVIHHHGVKQDYEVGGYTWYCSRPRQACAGTLVYEGRSVAVEGLAWFDHQWGKLGPQMMAGWTWMGIQLDGGKEVMLFFRRTPTGSAVGATVSQGGRSQCLDGAPVSLTTTARWKSPRTGISWGTAWDVMVEGEKLTVTAQPQDQEMPAGPMLYWEGCAQVSGATAGRAYVEQVGNFVVHHP